MSLILLVLLVLLIVAALPNWGYHKLGFAPSSIAGVALFFLAFLLMTGQL